MNHPLLRACRQQHDSIVLRWSRDGYVAEQWGNLYEQAMKLFGTNLILTAFTFRAEPSHVLDEIKRLNPGVEVMLGAPLYQLTKEQMHKSDIV